MKTLCVFDMDHTLCDAYSQESFLHHVPREFFDPIFDKYLKHQIKWPHLLHTVINAHPPNIENIKKYMQTCQMVPHMKQVLKMLDSMGHTIILVSGSNRICVETFLQNHQITNHFKARFCLQMNYDHIQNNFIYYPNILDCKQPICTHGYCKGEVLKNYLDTTPHDRVFYFGDGINDLCGISEINHGIAFVRKDHPLENNIKNNSQKYGKYIKCQVIYWQDGHDIAKYFQDTEKVVKI